MIATPEQYRTLADLIERGPVTAIIMLGHHMIVATGCLEEAAKDAPLTRIYPDGTFDKPKFLDAETMR